MQVGDLVRCRRRAFLDPDDQDAQEIWEMGIVVEPYEKWQKLVVVMIDGKVVNYHAREVQLASRASR